MSAAVSTSRPGRRCPAAASTSTSLRSSVRRRERLSLSRVPTSGSVDARRTTSYTGAVRSRTATHSCTRCVIADRPSGAVATASNQGRSSSATGSSSPTTLVSSTADRRFDLVPNT
jgi:hypothetical protein